MNGPSTKVSSRLFIKGIPSYLTRERLKEHFSSHGGHVTDAHILKKPDGKSRHVAFVGFQDEESAKKALEYFNGTFIDTSKLYITYALPIGDQALEKKAKVEVTIASKPKETKKEFFETKKSKKMEEFMKLMQSRSKNKIWESDDYLGAAQNKKNHEDDDDDDDDDTEEEVHAEQKKPANDDDDDDDDALDIDTTNNQIRLTTKKASSTNIADSSRLFLRNLSFSCNEDDIRNLVTKFGPVSEVHLPLDHANQSKGFGFVTFVHPEHAVKALANLDGTTFQGRLLHIIAATPRTVVDENLKKGMSSSSSSYKAIKEAKLRENAQNTNIWSALFVRQDTAMDAMAEKLNVSKSQLLFGDSDKHEDEDNDAAENGETAAVRAALNEAKIIEETKAFLIEEGVNLDALEASVIGKKQDRSKTVILVKNLPVGSDILSLREVFAKVVGDDAIERFVMPPSNAMALVSFFQESDAARAFKSLAYKRYRKVPLFLEMAPDNTINPTKNKKKNFQNDKEEEDSKTHADLEQDNEVGEQSLFVTSLDFGVTEEMLREHFESLLSKKLGSKNQEKLVRSVRIPRKGPKKDQSVGYGFVEMTSEDAAKRAKRTCDGTELLGRKIEVRYSHAGGNQQQHQQLLVTRKGTEDKKRQVRDEESEGRTKILIRNLAFEATKSEIRSLFAAHGEIKSVRMPKKTMSSREHRGFAFVEFLTHQEAVNAFEALSSAHLYGRHLILEWAKEDDSVDELRKQAQLDASEAKNDDKDAPRKKLKLGKRNEDDFM